MQFAWSGEKLPLSPRDVSLWEKTEARILAGRLGGIMLSVVDDNGQPLKGVIVRYEQVSHDFCFGVHYPYHDRVYDLLQEIGINAATLWLGWKYVEPERGTFNWPYLDAVWNVPELSRRGLQLLAHSLNWFKPGWHVVPDYLHDVRPKELPTLVYGHISTILQHWGPYINHYELVNEPFWVNASGIPMSMEEMVRICNAAAVAIRDARPDARLEVNFAEISRVATYLIRPCDLLEALDKANIPCDVIGLQQFENAFSVTEPPTVYRSKSLSSIIYALRQYAGLGKGLRISALAVPSQPPRCHMPAHYEVPYGTWDETQQARYLDAAYTYYFAEAEVEGITWWCPVDGRLAYIPNGGLLREDLSPKPAYYALKNWIARHTTSGQTRTDDEGKAIVRGYAGEYHISVSTGPTGRQIRATIKAHVVNDKTVVLTYNP